MSEKKSSFFKTLESKCFQVRKDVLYQISEAGVGHIGGCLSIIEGLVVLYEFMNIDPKNPKKEDRDRLVVSKGHCGPSVYAILSQRGFFAKDWLKTLNKNGTNLPSHCDMNKTPGIDMTTGSLGQGLSVGIGMAIASKHKKDNSKIYVILGDGEIQEGQIWEAVMYSGNLNHLNNLVAILDFNGAQIDGSVNEICNIEPVKEKWKSFGWNTFLVENGNSCEQVYNAFIEIQKIDRGPSILILKTTKGYGLEVAEKLGIDNHSMSFSKEMYEDFIKKNVV